MYTKKLLTIGIVAGSLLFLVGCGTKTTNVTTDETTTGVTETSSTKASKDQCMELMAFAMKVALLQAQGDNAGALEWAQKANDLEILYGNKGLEYEETCNKFMTDASFMQAVQDFLKELKK